MVKLNATHNDSLPTARRGRARETRSMEVAGMAEGDRVVGVRVAHGWDAETAAPLVLLQLRTDVGDVGLVSLSADLAQMLVDQVVTAIGIVREETG